MAIDEEECTSICESSIILRVNRRLLRQRISSDSFITGMGGRGPSCQSKTRMYRCLSGPPQGCRNVLESSSSKFPWGHTFIHAMWLIIANPFYLSATLCFSLYVRTSSHLSWGIARIRANSESLESRQLLSARNCSFFSPFTAKLQNLAGIGRVSVNLKSLHRAIFHKYDPQTCNRTFGD